MLWSIVFSLGINALLYFYMDSRMMNSFRGKLIAGHDPWDVITDLSELVQKARIIKPKVILVSSLSPQAFVMGKSHRKSYIVLTDGFLLRLTRAERRAILAYCIASIRHNNTFPQLVTGTFNSLLLWVASQVDRVYRWLVGVKSQSPLLHNQPCSYLVSPIAGLLLHLNISKADYFYADSLATKYIESPLDLASALWKLDSYSRTLPYPVSPPLAQGFVVNPLTSGGWTRYFQTHPSAKERIEKLVGYYPI